MAKNPAVAVEPTEATQAVKPAFQFKVLKNVTLPLIKLEIDTPEYVKLTGTMFVGKEVKGTGDKAKMEPAVLCHCVNLQTGENAQIIVNAVVKENLNDNYPENSYVGKSFELIKHDKREGKRYNDFSITEIEVG
jgi:hypothetical protein